MSADDYESLPTTSVAVNMTAGAIAGVLEHCIMYPLDSVKTRMQSLSIPSYDISETFRNMIRKEGLMRPIRGVTAVVAGAGPAHALYFGSYEMTKELFTKLSRHNNLNYMASGAVATVIHDAVSNPTEVIKQRMQMYDSPYRSVLQCMRGIYKTEGLKAFYRSYSTQLVMNVPYQSIHFVTYEFFQNLLNSDRRYNPAVHVVAGGAAGAAAAAVTTPLDVVKTLLNTQETGFTRGMAEAVKRIYTLAGPWGFFKGITARVLYAIPATAICWSTYEFFKYYLCGMEKDQYKSSITGKNLLQPRDTAAAILPSTILAEAKLAQLEEGQAENMYVLPSASKPVLDISIEAEAAAAAPALATATTATPPPSQPIPPAGSIKSVCDLSATKVATPTLNLHTRHTDVKTPYDHRGIPRT